ncbi:MAG: hemerythrin domain-containing protein [Acidobacteriia bacterium]|nr:hemerythrin domain-containing protein [Terriglobia bacterium]
MSKALETLMEEHRVIEQVLGSLETFGGRLGDSDVRPTLRDYGRFFRDFADRCHHAKEEDRLFVEMVRHGFPREHGPIAVMLSDHVEGRAHVGAIAKAGESAGPLSAEERSSILFHIHAYVPLLRSHIMKEDNVLYPMARQALPADVLEQLSREFDDHEHGAMGEGTHEELRHLAERLIASYPPAEAAGAGPSCLGCAAHGAESER